MPVFPVSERLIGNISLGKVIAPGYHFKKIVAYATNWQNSSKIFTMDGDG